MIYNFTDCNAQYAGILLDQNYSRVIIPVGNDDSVSVTTQLVAGSVGSLVMRLRKSNLANPLAWTDYSPHVDLVIGGTTEVKAIESGYLCVEVTTAAGGTARVDVSIYTAATGG